MTIPEIVGHRSIREVLHFTTHQGLIGVLHSRSLKSRKRLEKDQQLEYIFSPNAAFRKDAAWLDYVNLSIGRINTEFFSKANRWHQGRALWWCVLSFDPIILTHEGVFFATTNNIYTGVRRAKGIQGLQALFGEKIVRWQQEVVVRDSRLSPAFPTCIQAEVLYPAQLSTNFLQKVYVANDEDSDEVHGQLEALNHSKIPVIVSPEVFGLPIR